MISSNIMARECPASAGQQGLAVANFLPSTNRWTSTSLVQQEERYGSKDVLTDRIKPIGLRLFRATHSSARRDKSSIHSMMEDLVQIQQTRRRRLVFDILNSNGTVSESRLVVPILFTRHLTYVSFANIFFDRHLRVCCLGSYSVCADGQRCFPAISIYHDSLSCKRICVWFSVPLLF